MFEKVVMPVKNPSKAATALEALRILQDDAKRKGLDTMSVSEINAEIAKYRQEKRLRQKPVRKAR